MYVSYTNTKSTYVFDGHWIEEAKLKEENAQNVILTSLQFPSETRYSCGLLTALSPLHAL